jgi:hypothetical protein
VLNHPALEPVVKPNHLRRRRGSAASHTNQKPKQQARADQAMLARSASPERKAKRARDK